MSNIWLINLVLITLGSYDAFSMNVNDTVQIYQSEKIDKLVQKHIRVNSEATSSQGYRLQIAADVDRDNVMETKGLFLQQYPHIPIYLQYIQPYFKLRVGDFKNQLEAQKFKQELGENFKGAFIVPDKIKVAHK